MKLYKFLDIPNYDVIANKVYDYLINHTGLIEKEYRVLALDKMELLKSVPELGKYLISHKLFLDWATAIHCPVGENLPIHIDYHEPDQPDHTFLFPIKNCVGTTNVFYDVPETDRKYSEYENNNYPFRNYKIVNDASEYRKLLSFELTKPAIFNPTVAHKVFVGPDSGPRISLAMMCKNDLATHFDMEDNILDS